MTLKSTTVDGWKVTGTLVLRAGRVEVDSFELSPPSGLGYIESLSALRRLNLGEIETFWRGNLQEWMRREMAPDWRAGLTVKRPGRAGRDEYFYARWVRRYVDACRLETRSPVAELARRHPGETVASINRYLRKAEALELIEPRRRGKAGATLTEAGRRMVAELAGE